LYLFNYFEKLQIFSQSKPQLIDNLLKECLGKFLNALQDADINVRRVALVTFNSAAHNKPSLVRDLLIPNQVNGGAVPSSSLLIQHLYNETKVIFDDK
jgi:cullin-associated NEDD8-dissociated protein 1